MFKVMGGGAWTPAMFKVMEGARIAAMFKVMGGAEGRQSCSR